MIQNAVQFAHHLWQQWVQPNDIVIDATCGNGHDTLFLASLVPQGKVHGLDIQEAAIQNTREKLKQHNLIDRVQLYQQSHAYFPQELESQSVRLIVYNLGYLPGGDKSLTTLTPTTLESINNAMSLLTSKGTISITLYPGHPEGREEQKALLAFAKQLPSSWIVHHTEWLNRQAAPSLLLLQRESHFCIATF